jgi:transcriptional antiterminator NusG
VLEAFEGTLREIDEAESRVTVELNIFGRPTPIELERWMIERAE